MIKLEAQFKNKGPENDPEDFGEVTFKVTASSESDLRTLDAIVEALSGGYPLKVGFSNQHTLIIKAEDAYIPLPKPLPTPKPAPSPVHGHLRG